ncbi:MAG: hypothetical protein JHD35_15120 [Sphingopyxis sp.]|uniref:hypothetical protein n=1 Tax=Sphingobium sp. TaxID=1912891 RepID=UPI001A259410|nr:hypothetical protein [Sphingobium sp.]MBJ7440339.1 hypothetical protein [Sphingopyxis sp.]
MQDRNDRDVKGRGRRNGLAVIGVALVLGIATLSAYMLSGNDATVKPATGTAQAMALASSNASTPD